MVLLLAGWRDLVRRLLVGYVVKPPRVYVLKFDVRFYSRLSFGFVDKKRNALLSMYEYRCFASKARLVFKDSSWGCPNTSIWFLRKEDDVTLIDVMVTESQ
jgi:hypothetical protein